MNYQQKKIEKAYQRAMNIRDSSPGKVCKKVEMLYGKAYRRAYKESDVNGFKPHTRRYLKMIRKANGRTRYDQI